MYLFIKAKPLDLFVAGLGLQVREVKGALVHTGGCASLQAVCLKAEGQQGFGQALRSSLACPARSMQAVTSEHDKQ